MTKVMRFGVAVTAVVVLAACGGNGGESAVAVCDDFDALVIDDQNLPEDWDRFEPVIDRADDVDELADPAANIRGDVETGSDLQLAVEGFYNRCVEAGWEHPADR